MPKINFRTEFTKVLQILELILLFGNILNTGSRNEQSVGFDISYLPKFGGTKDRNNKGTLMTFLVEIIETSHPELSNFYVSVKLISTITIMDLFIFSG